MGGGDSEEQRNERDDNDDGGCGKKTLQSTNKRLRRMTLDEGTIKEDPGRGMTRMTIKTMPSNRNRDNDDHGTVRVSASASASVSVSEMVDGCLAEMVENNNDAEMGTNVGAVEG